MIRGACSAELYEFRGLFMFDFGGIWEYIRYVLRWYFLDAVVTLSISSCE